MDIEEKARDCLERLYALRPQNFVREIDAKSRGLFIIMLYVSRAKGEIYAGDISKRFNVSTARVAVALKTLVKKGLVTTACGVDRRKVVVRITEEGLEYVRKKESEAISFMKYIINGVGEKDFDEFVRVFKKINLLLTMKR